MQHANYIIDAITAALKAGKAILDIYDSDFAVESKADKSPLTLADKESHKIIMAILAKHNFPIVSEEGKSISYEKRKDWDVAWIVDPLDGTKEFVKRNGEFTVNIALIENQRPIMGVVYAPVPQWLYIGAPDIGAHKITELRPDLLASERSVDPQKHLETIINGGRRLPLDQPDKEKYMIVGSRSHSTPELEAFVEQKRREMGQVDFIAAGSSLKICLVAEGTADIYPRLGPTMEWDTAAGQAVAESAGASVYIYPDGSDLLYNREDQLNPYFIVERKK